MIGFVGSVLIGSVTRVALLADDPPAEIDPTTGKGPEWGKAAPVGLLIILLMGIALYFLIKSMNKNLRKVPSSFDTDIPDADVADDGDQAGFSSADGAGPDPDLDPDEPPTGTAADRVERPR